MTHLRVMLKGHPDSNPTGSAAEQKRQGRCGRFSYLSQNSFQDLF